MKTAIAAFLLLAALVTANPTETNTASSAATASRESRWREDLDSLARELPARHLDFFKLIPKRKFDREVRNLKGELPRLSDAEVVFRLMRLVTDLRVAHTWIGFPARGPAFHGYPFKLEWFSDGLAVVAASPEYGELIGARVLKIGSLTSEQAVAAVAPYISHENETWLHHQSPLWLRNAELLQYLKIAQSGGRVRLSLTRRPSTFSSRLHAAVQLRDEAGATLVGQPTGGKPNCYGNAPHFVLPNSQMQVHYYTTRYRLITNADPASLEPDIRVALLLRDFLAGCDPPLEAALHHAP